MLRGDLYIADDSDRAADVGPTVPNPLSDGVFAMCVRCPSRRPT
jgi:hypothetical protein